MKRYLAITEEYERFGMGAPTYRFFYAKDDNEAVLHEHRAEYDGDPNNVEELTAFVEAMECENGDGKDYVTIINLKEEAIIFGGNHG